MDSVQLEQLPFKGIRIRTIFALFLFPSSLPPLPLSSLFCCWRKLKNPWFPGRTLFRPSCFGTGKKKRFFAQLAHSAGPTCISYLAEEASDRLEFLPSWDSMDQDLLLLYGQYRSTLVDHMDVEKATNLDEIETHQ